MSRSFLLNIMPKESVCAEIGVWKGAFTKEILSCINPSKLYLVDPWAYQPKFRKNLYGGKRGLIKNQENMDVIYNAIKSRYQNNKKIEILRGYSSDMLNKISDGCLDWAYIDGNHAYKYVLEDLRLCYLKVKNSGYICGDDYSGGWKGVIKAVSNFLSDNDNVEQVLIKQRQFVLRKIR